MPYKAIVTRYAPATNTRGARIVATAEGGNKPHRVSVPYDHSGELSSHFIAVKELCNKLNWGGELVAGAMPDGNGYAWVFVDFVRDTRDGHTPKMRGES